MSLGNSAALYRAIYDILANDAGVTAVIGTHIYDALPAGPLPEVFISLGAEVVSDRSDKTGRGSEHDFTISVITTQPGFLRAKDVATAIGHALLDQTPDFGGLSVVYLNFTRADARRDTDTQTRRIDLGFRARIDNQA